MKISGTIQLKNGEHKLDLKPITPRLTLTQCVGVDNILLSLNYFSVIENHMVDFVSFGL